MQQERALRRCAEKCKDRSHESKRSYFDTDRKLCIRPFSDRSTSAKRIPPRSFPTWEASSAAFLVYIAAVLFYKPIFTQPLCFILCAAGAVEKSATERAVCVVYLRDSIGISKINAAFLTGQQIDRIHVQQLLSFIFGHVQTTQRLLLYHVLSQKTIAFLTKDTHKNFLSQKHPTGVE